MINLMNDKKILFMIRYGSYNYNLDTINSDIDWRGFSNNVDYKEVLNFGMKNNDICINNTMYLYKALTEMTPKFIELLFSNKIIISDKVSDKTKSLINELLNLKNNIATMDLKQMYNSYLHEFYMHQNWMVENKNPRKNINYMIHSYRILDILVRFSSMEFKNYKQAIYYSNDDISRNVILDFKFNKISVEDFKIITNEKLIEALTLESKFDKKVNLTLTKQLKYLIDEISKEEVI